MLVAVACTSKVGSQGHHHHMLLCSAPKSKPAWHMILHGLGDPKPVMAMALNTTTLPHRSTQLAALWVLLAGALCQTLSMYLNMGRFSNSIALWLGMEVRMGWLDGTDA